MRVSLWWRRVALEEAVDKGRALFELDRWEEAVAVYDEVSARFGDRTEPEIATQVAWAMGNEGWAHASTSPSRR